MDFRKQGLSINEAKEMDMVDYLSGLGHEPAKIRNTDYWYLSPLRDEKTPSFKVNRKLNRWYDHGLGKGGNLVDFAILYHNCTVGEFLQKLNSDLSFQKPHSRHPEEQVIADHKINILQDFNLSSFALLRYLEQRKIPVEISEQFCREVRYELNNKIFYGIGFKNDSGGYELRNPYFKASSSPKDITTINNGAKEAAVFEGFTDFLSFKAIHKNQGNKESDFVILNSASFFEKARPFMEQHEAIRLYLDRDTTGQNYSRYALSLSDKYKDESLLYQHHKDFNNWLMNLEKPQRKKLGHKLK
ncbi:toprim domain-containing protein [Pontibacter sp. 172403-2]|uniref:toprim domain-containing protein n=1 Tax=Pontibacter rufus TaxID=2791028 RepID=UPI0018AFCB33|nr:toprim domain-containing protein [Pontibacter sp. 172403-2]MBF9252256.1 toprim domain-containing protein [Pontibacter sp. 172403-2]